jgi:competence protein ComEA
MIRKTLLAAAFALSSTAAGAQPTVDLNRASAEHLAAALDGVGAARAQAIVEYREANGPFESVDAVVEVNGVGPATLEQNRDRLSIEAQ